MRCARSSTDAHRSGPSIAPPWRPAPDRPPREPLTNPLMNSEHSSMTDTPDLAPLTRWFFSWVTDEGAINGFHNHSVWGTNPATFLDWTSGHAAFSAPALGAI